MATEILFSPATMFFYFLFMSSSVVSQPLLNPAEQEAVYRVLESINPVVPWRSVFPEDLCSSAPHGVACDYFDDQAAGGLSVHVTELSFGYVSDYSANPPCGPNSTLDASLFSPFPHLRKLFFYRCFTGSRAADMPDFSPLGGSLKELVFIENPSLVGFLGDHIRNLERLRRLVLTGTSLAGKIPPGLGDLINLEQLTLSRSKFDGEISVNFSKLKNLKVLDLSQNGFQGNVPESLGNGSTGLLKLDLSFNGFSGNIPESLKGLKKLEFLDLSYNQFGNYGAPLFLGEMPGLREVYLSGNLLGGRIPEIWENVSGIVRIGLSQNGLVGNIPASLVGNLGNLCYLGLDNNKLEGTVPEEFGSWESVSELHLENNNLSGKVPFSAEFVARIGDKLKLEGNPELCADEEFRSAVVGSSLGHLKPCNKPDVPKSALLHGDSSSLLQSYASNALVALMLLINLGIMLLMLL